MSEYRLEVDNSTAHNSQKSLKIIGIIATGNALNAKARHEPVPVENGKTFTVAFWAKVDANEGQSRKVDVSLQMQQDPWPGAYNKTIVLNSTDWKEYTAAFYIMAEELTDIWPGLCVAESDIDFWIDDFRFFEDRPDAQKSVEQIKKLSASWGHIKLFN